MRFEELEDRLAPSAPGINTTTALAALVNGSAAATIIYGTSVTLTATVVAQSGTVAPALGFVDFKDDTANFDLGVINTDKIAGSNGIFTLVTTPTQLQVIQSNGALHTITAVYSPGIGFNGSTATLAGALIVTPAPLTFFAISNTKPYDSTTTTAALPTVTGLVIGDTVTGLTEVYADRNAGSGKTLSVGSYTVNDRNNGNNYTVATVVNLTGVIKKASLTIAAATSTKVYDATTSSAAVPSVTGLIGNDMLSDPHEAYVNRNADPATTPIGTLTGLNSPLNIAVDGSGNLIVASHGGLKIFAPGSSKPTGSLNVQSPYAIAFDAKGNLYISGGTSLSEFAPGATTPILTIGGLNVPDALAFDANGNLFVANEGNNTVSEFAPGATNPITTFNGFANPSGLAFDTIGNLYVVNQTSVGSVTKLVPATNSRQTLSGGLSNPNTILVDSIGNIFVASFNGTIVDKFAPGSSTPSATLTGLQNPMGMVIDASGNLYVANEGGNTVSKFAPGATTPTATLTGVNGPWGLAMDASGNLYVANYAGNAGTTISKFANPAAPSHTSLSVTTYTVQDGNNGANYTVTTIVNTTGLITPAPLTITAATNTKSYDSTVSAAAVATGMGLKGNDTFTAGENYDNDNAGSGKTLSLVTYTVNDGNGGDNYAVTTVSISTGVINRAPLTITAVSNTKTYDSGFAANAKPLISGLIGGDHFIQLADSYADKNVGTGKFLNVTYNLSDGNGGANYIITTIGVSSGVITKAALAVIATANTKIYDATVTTIASPRISGLTGGDSVTGLAEVYADKNVGTNIILSVSAYTINDGNGGNNYSITLTPITAGMINPVSLKIAVLANTKIYDATTTAAVQPAVTGLLGNDSISHLSERYEDQNTGTNKTLTLAAYVINDGNGGKNYTVATVGNSSGAISRAPLTITASANTKTYDSTMSAAAIPTVTGLMNGDSLSGLFEVYSDLNAGSKKSLSVSACFVNDGNGGNNYTVQFVPSSTGVINPVPLTLTALSNTKFFDGSTYAATVPAITGSLIGNDAMFGLAEEYASLSVGSSKTLSVSTYTIIDGAGGMDYAVTMQTDATGVINPGTPGTVVAVGSFVGRTPITVCQYGTPVSLTATVAPISGSSPPAGGVDFQDVSAGIDLGVTDSVIISGSNAIYSLITTPNILQVLQANGGVHTITASYYSSSSGPIPSSGTLLSGLAVTPAHLTIAATPNTRTYDGTTNAAALPNVTGLIGTDQVTGFAEVYSTRTAGTGLTLSVSAYTVRDNNGGSNYTVTTDATSTGVILPAPLTINAVSNTKTYDATTSAGAVPTVTGLIGGDTIASLAEVYADRNAAANKTLNVSTYTISDGNHGNNYAVTTVSDSTGLINSAPLTITATTNTKYFDSTTGAAALPTVQGLLGSDTMTGLLEVYDTTLAGTGKTLTANYRLPYTVSSSATLGGLNSPQALAVDAQGDVFVSNEGNQTISEFAPGGTALIATLGGLGDPVALTFDHQGDLFAVNKYQGTVSEFAPGAIIPMATLTGLNWPVAITVDRNNNLYVANYDGNTVSVFAPGATTPTATLTGLNQPQAVAVDGYGNVYVANRAANTVSVFALGPPVPPPP